MYARMISHIYQSEKKKRVYITWQFINALRILIKKKLYYVYDWQITWRHFQNIMEYHLWLPNIDYVIMYWDRKISYSSIRQLSDVTLFISCLPAEKLHGLSDYSGNGPLSRYVKLRVAHAPGMLGTFSPPPRVSDPDVSVAGKTLPASPAHAQPTVLHISWETHDTAVTFTITLFVRNLQLYNLIDAAHDKLVHWIHKEN